ncbi:unnamed protein product [Citrullus colocynthis]|uniref:DUF674 family protein n=1 Tax=Citrullus colocynthis TaxID=252529 RepID=A0ABP0YT94_9ROSI
MTQQTTNVRLKLLIDTETRSVLYAEADKDFIDFLFNLLSLPLGAVIRLLTKEHMVGCLGNLYESVETLNETCFIKPSQAKEALLRPKVSFNCCNNSTNLLPYTTIETSSSYSDSQSSVSPSSTSSYVNTDSGVSSHVSTDSSFSFGFRSCPISLTSYVSTGSSSVFGSHRPISTSSCVSTGSGFTSDSGGNYFSPFVGPPLNIPSASRSSGCKASSNISEELKVGFVKGLATYIVMDDLTVKHISDFSIVSLFKEFNIKDAHALEEKVITLNVDEGVELLRASLQSKMVLTDVFLRRERQTIDNYNDG